jgi:hypothetical protein
MFKRSGKGNLAAIRQVVVTIPIALGAGYLADPGGTGRGGIGACGTGISTAPTVVTIDRKISADPVARSQTRNTGPVARRLTVATANKDTLRPIKAVSRVTNNAARAPDA